MVVHSAWRGSEANKSVRDFLHASATDCVDNLIRRVEAMKKSGTILELAKGQSKGDADVFFAITVGGPFTSAQDALDSLASLLLDQKEILRPLSGRDITGAGL
jgi:hypothetical protein